MGDPIDEAKDLSPTEICPSAKTPRTKIGKRQASVQTQPLQRDNIVSRRNSQPAVPGSARPRLQNISSIGQTSSSQGKHQQRPTTSSTSARAVPSKDTVRGSSSAMPGDGNVPVERKPRSSLPRASKNEPSKRPELGKGRLERGKQISHLGLFPLSGQVQRQSTSMNVERGSVDQAADIEETSSTGQQDRKTSGSWRKQIDHFTKSLTEYAETHPQFSSHLSSCRLDKILGLRTVKTLKGDQLSINITFGTTSALSDSRAKSATSGKTKSLANLKHRSVEKMSAHAGDFNQNRNFDQNQGPDLKISSEGDFEDAKITTKTEKAPTGNGEELDSSVSGNRTETNDSSK